MLDRDLPLKKEIAKNILHIIKSKRLTQLKVSEMSGISKSTLSDYINHKTLISPSNVEKLSQALNVSSSEIDPSFGSDQSAANMNLTDKEQKKEKDVAKRVHQLRMDLESADALAFMGEPLSNEAKESLMGALEFIVRQTNEINKKYIPKKYRDKE